MPAPSEIERNNLESHVELCALRYAALENRLDTIESKVNVLQDMIQKSHMSMVRVVIGTAGTVIAGVLSMIAVILLK